MKFIGQKYIIPTNLRAIAVIMYFHGRFLCPLKVHHSDQSQGYRRHHVLSRTVPASCKGCVRRGVRAFLYSAGKRRGPGGSVQAYVTDRHEPSNEADRPRNPFGYKNVVT